jgi:hypothetical protein
VLDNYQAAQEDIGAHSCECSNEFCSCMKGDEILDRVNDCQLFKADCGPSSLLCSGFIRIMLSCIHVSVIFMRYFSKTDLSAGVLKFSVFVGHVRHPKGKLCLRTNS